MFVSQRSVYESSFMRIKINKKLTGSAKIICWLFAHLFNKTKTTCMCAFPYFCLWLPISFWCFFGKHSKSEEKRANKKKYEKFSKCMKTNVVKRSYFSNFDRNSAIHVHTTQTLYTTQLLYIKKYSLSCILPASVCLKIIEITKASRVATK